MAEGAELNGGGGGGDAGVSKSRSTYRRASSLARESPRTGSQNLEDNVGANGRRQSINLTRRPSISLMPMLAVNKFAAG